jgi:hypothetical protein
MLISYGGIGYNLADLTDKVGRDRWVRRGRPSGPSLPAAPHNQRITTAESFDLTVRVTGFKRSA